MQLAKLVFAILMLCLLGAAPSLAQNRNGGEPSVFMRFYYSHWLDGKVLGSPFDPAGAYEGEVVDTSTKGALEMVVFGHFGLSYSRQKIHREFIDSSSQFVDENSLQRSYNLTLYGKRVRHDQFNYFLGGGLGRSNYLYSVNGISLQNADLHTDMSSRRWFAGVEYSFDRIGFRVEFGDTEAERTFGGQTARLDQSFRYLTVFIPLN